MTNRDIKYRWMWISVGAYALGVAAAFLLSDHLLERGTTPEIMISALTLLAVTGLTLGGIGQLLRSAAHNSKRLSTMDGVGKVLSLFGWSVGVTSAILFATAQGNTPPWIQNWALGLIVAAFFVLLIIFLWIYRHDKKPKNEDFDRSK